jgi:hypothetical protein
MSQYRDVPKIFEFWSEEERNVRLMEHLQQMYREVKEMMGGE